MSEEANGSAAAAAAPGEAPAAELAELALEDSAPKVTFTDQFKAFSKFGDTKSDGKLITLSQSDKWMKQAKVIDKQITTTDTGIHFKKFKAMKISLADYNKFLDDLAKTKKVELAQIKQKMANCGAPGVLQVSVSGRDYIRLIYRNSNYSISLGWQGCCRCGQADGYQQVHGLAQGAFRCHRQGQRHRRQTQRGRWFWLCEWLPAQGYL